MADSVLSGCSRARRNLTTSGVQPSTHSLCIKAARACSQGTKLVETSLLSDLRGAVCRFTWQPSRGCALNTLWKALHTLGNCQKHACVSSEGTQQSVPGSTFGSRCWKTLNQTSKGSELTFMSRTQVLACTTIQMSGVCI